MAKETPEQELKRLRALVEVQNDSIQGYSDFSSSMPFCISDIISDYNYWRRKIEYLSEEGSDPAEFG